MKIQIKPRSTFTKVIDSLMIPLMYLISGTFKEKPQQTHKWNIQKLSKEEAGQLDESLKIKVKGVPSFIGKHWGILFHFPIFGGWRHYTVLQPENPEGGYYVGWGTEVSKILLFEAVRLLNGPEGAYFHAFNKSGEQIKLVRIGEGKVGNNSYFSKLPLL